MKSNQLKTLLCKEPYHWRFWLLIAFFARLFIFILELHNQKFPSPVPGVWGIIDGDTNEYLTPIDNLVKNGSYDPDFRMPGYGVFYLPLAMLFSKVVAYNILILFQLLCSVVSTYLLALTAFMLFNKRIFFYATFILYATSIYSFYADIFLLTESLTTSFLIISVFSFVTYFKNYKKGWLISSGTFLTGVIFLRPVYAPFLVFFLVILVANLVKQKRTIFMPVLLFLSVFALCDGSWIIRNYLHYKRIIPLTKEVFYVVKKVSFLNPLMDFGSAYGGRIEWWDPRTGPYWLMHNDTIAFDMQDTIFVLSKDTVFNGKKIPKERGIPLPADVYTSKFNLDTLLKVRRQLQHYRSLANLPENGQAKLLDTIDKKLAIYVQSIEDEKPLSFHIKARWNMLKEFLDEVSYELPYIRYTYRIYHILILLFLGFGIMGILFMLRYGFRLSVQFIVALIPLFVIIIHPLVLRLTVGRYFDPAFPFILICAIYAVFKVKDIFSKPGSSRTTL
jgi:hypothetical protein